MIVDKNKAQGAGQSPDVRSQNGGDQARNAAAVSTPAASRRLDRLTRERANVLVGATIKRIHSSTSSDAIRDTAAQIRELHRIACEVILANEGCVLDLQDERILAAFGPGLAANLDPAVQATKAATQLQLELAKMRTSKPANTQKTERAGAENALALAIGIHGIGVPASIGSGPADAAQAKASEIAANLCGWSGARAWSVVVEQSVRDRMPDAITIGRNEVGFLGTQSGPTRIFEVLGFAHDPKTKAEGRGGNLLRALTDNSAMLARAAGFRRAQTAGGNSIDSLIDSHEVTPTIEGYRGLRRIARGGMSTVYMGHPVKGGAPHALKVLDFTSGDNELVVQRFIEEHALIAQLRHPNVVHIFGQGFTEAHAYIAMEYIGGGDLRTLIAAGVRPSNALRILAQITAGLAAIHEAGILHMDLKPDNVMLREDGSLAIADFGIAQTKDRAACGPKDGESFGTPQYVSPEQALGQPTDSRSDLYSLGVLLFEMLAGRKPFSADLAERSARNSGHVATPQLPVSLSALQPLIDALLAHAPADRLGTAKELLDFVPIFYPAAAAADNSHTAATDVDRRIKSDRTVPLPTTNPPSTNEAVATERSSPQTPPSGAGRSAQ
jgi:serine/threonine-protein kinase PpkA